MTGFQADGFSAPDPPRCGSKVVGNGGPAAGFGSEVTGDSASGFVTLVVRFPRNGLA